MSKTKLIKDIKEYFNKCFTEDLSELLENNSIQILAFSYLLGLPIEECHGLCVEDDWTNDQIEEYNEIEDAIFKIKLSERIG